MSALEKYRNDAPEEAEGRIAELEAVIAEFDDLIANSDGVDGLRGNGGNFASWQWLKTTEGGRLEKYAALKRGESNDDRS